MSKTIAQVLAIAQAQLAISSESPKVDSEYLLAHVLQKPSSFLIGFSDYVVSDQLQKQLSALVVRRMQGEPVAYLTGKQGFWSLSLNTSPATLIPRPETEILVETMMALADQKSKTILDLGTGTGAVALAIAHEYPQWQVCASDESEQALQVARENAAQLQINNVEFRQGSWCKPWQDKIHFFDVVASNPPYVREDDPHLMQGDVRFEPRLALVSGADGLDAIRQIAQDVKHVLKKGGWLIIEHGFDQGQAVRNIFSQNEFSGIETLKDLNGHDRVCKGQWI